MTCREWNRETQEKNVGEIETGRAKGKHASLLGGGFWWFR
jgi:hypothetical protein